MSTEYETKNIHGNWFESKIVRVNIWSFYEHIILMIWLDY